MLTLDRTSPPTGASGRRIIAAAAVAAVLGIACSLAAAAEDTGVIGKGDRMRLIVPERPALEQVLTVDEDGKVDVSQVGEVQLGGLSVADATVLLKQRIRLLYPTIDSVTLDLLRTGQMRIYVLGDVGTPGVVSFEKQPTLWDVLRSAGGPAEGANLADARIIREEGEGGPTVHRIDLGGVLDGTATPEFELRDGDTLVIPRSRTAAAGLTRDEGVRVFGGVNAPSVVDIKEPTPLMDVLMMAGAPSSTADLKKVWWVHRVGGTPRAELVNVKAFMETADPRGNPDVHPGDTLEIGFQKSGFLRSNLPLILGLVTASTTLYIAINK